jgi:hypothetical protein
VVHAAQPDTRSDELKVNLSKDKQSKALKFATIVEAVQRGRLKVSIDVKKVCGIDCPLPFGYLKERIVYAYLLLMVVVAVAGWWLAIGLQSTSLVAAAGTFIYWVVVRPLAEAHIRRIVVRTMLEDEDRWAKLWRFGGVTLQLPEGSVVHAGKGRWEDVAERLTDVPASGERTAA